MPHTIYTACNLSTPRESLLSELIPPEPEHSYHLLLFFCGMLCLGVLRHIEWLMVPEAILAGVGAALIAAAHSLNLKYSKDCKCCEPRR